MHTFSIISFVALLSTVAAGPVAVPGSSPLENRDASAPSPTVVRGSGGVQIALPLQTPAPEPDVVAEAARLLTIKIFNQWAKLSTSHASNVGSPPVASGAAGTGTIAAGDTVSFAVPVNYAGNVAFAGSGAPITGADSLIEFNYVNSIADVDVSYV
jgi:hypothetical protein